MTNHSSPDANRIAHEGIYRKTVKGAIHGIEHGSFSETFVPTMLAQLKSELKQCIDLLLISPEFYQEQMDLLEAQESGSARLETVMQA